MSEQDSSARVLLFTGKGGVGKTSIAAATAVKSAVGGAKTLLVSSDFAHNLSDIFQIDLADRAMEVSENLSLLEVNILDEITENWDSVQSYLTQFMAYLGVEAVIAEEVALIPGIEELFLLTRILREIEGGNYDAVIIDAAPTAGTLRLLTFSDTSTKKLNRILNWERQILKLVRPFARRTKLGRELLPEDELYETFGTIIQKIGRLGDLLKDAEKSSIRLVLNPDPIAIAETRRTYIYLALFGFPVDGIFVNKLLPEEVSAGYFSETYRHQQRELMAIHSSFMETRIFLIPYLDTAPLGLNMLKGFGETIYGDEMPLDVLSEPNSVRFEKEDDRVLLTFILPNLDRESLDIGRKEGELIIKAGGYTRVLQLPDTLSRVDIDNASYENERLVVRFEAQMD